MVLPLRIQDGQIVDAEDYFVLSVENNRPDEAGAILDALNFKYVVLPLALSKIKKMFGTEVVTEIFGRLNLDFEVVNV